ncbi:MAG: sugar phosphate isomerase/epimerase [Candidatus Anammoximicrobium sp.]|nr:sugar phosphate isomerase/epimerase [Candidatus Anammoximicrobium sp.]
MPKCSGITRRQFVHRVLSVGSVALASPQLLHRSASATEDASTPWQIGIYTRPWDAHDYRVALDAMAEAGYRYAGLMTTAKTKDRGNLVISVETTLDESVQIGQEVKKRGLKLISIYGGGIPVHQSLQAGIDGMRKLIDNCVAAGSSSLLMGGTSNAKIVEDYYKAIAETCGYAAEKQLVITVKPHGGLNATGPQCRQCVEKVNQQNFRLWYDPGNIYFYSNGELDPVQDAGAVDGLVYGMSVKDYRHPKQVAVTPGTGQVDFRALMARLKRGGFVGGPLVIECLAPGELPALLQEAKKARAFVEDAVRT